MNFAGVEIDLGIPRVMGILNVTPDSFADGGAHNRRAGEGLAAYQQRLLDTASAMVLAGATFIDIGGESTRPGATPVSVAEEEERVLPAIEALAGRVEALISVDTSTPAVMRRGVRAGASFINDVRALTRGGALEAAAETGVPVCLMHMRGKPRTMQEKPHYQAVLIEVMDFLAARAATCRDAGIDAGQLIYDPGFGFGKTLEHNLELLCHLDRLAALGGPVLVGLSRKSMIGRLLDAEVGERLYGSVAAGTIALSKGAAILRVHDVGPTMDALKVWRALRELTDERACRGS